MMTPSFPFVPFKNGVRLYIRVSPKAKREGIEGLWNDPSAPCPALKIALRQPPVEGKANKALTAFCSDFFKLPKSAFSLASGALDRYKIIEIEGSIETLIPLLQEKLAPWLPSSTEKQSPQK